jgi:hypothetical protein
VRARAPAAEVAGSGVAGAYWGGGLAGLVVYLAEDAE